MNPRQSQQILMSPNMTGSELNQEDLDELLNRIRVIGSKLTKIRACGNSSTAQVAINNLWTLHWALKMLLQYMNQNNLELMSVHIDSIEHFANNTLERESHTEIEYLLTLLRMKEDK